MADLATTWDTWAQSKPKQPRGDRTIGYMHRLHGVNSEHVCGECAELWCKEYRRRYYHCGKYDKPGTNDGPGTDWRLWWLACGLFRERER